MGTELAWWRPWSQLLRNVPRQDALMTAEEIHEQMKELLGQPYAVLADWSLVDPAQRRDQEEN
jgi:hypothetical protein